MNYNRYNRSTRVFVLIIATLILISIIPVSYAQSKPSPKQTPSAHANEVLYGAKKGDYQIHSVKSALKYYKQKKVYRISPKTKPLKKSGFRDFSSYNKYTKQYYMIRSYLELMAKKGGGTLVLKKGTYKIPHTLYVPSNVTIILSNGVTVRKTTKTKTDILEETKSVFQLVSPKKSKIRDSVSGYSSSHNVYFIGVGNATINLDYKYEAMGIMLGHNKEVTIAGITFKNLNSGHFIECNSSKNVDIYNNSFINAKKKSDYVKEAINIDTPDDDTKGFGCPWSVSDKTPCKDIYIDSNLFQNIGRAVGTHKYSVKDTKQVYHENIVLTGNTIKQLHATYSVRIINWKNAKICYNSFSGTQLYTGKSKTTVCIMASGAVNPIISCNYMADTIRPICFKPTQNSGSGKYYPITYNYLSEECKEQLGNNIFTSIVPNSKHKKEDYIRIYPIYDIYINYEKVYLPDEL